MHRGERMAKVIAASVVLCLTLACIGWGISRSSAAEEKDQTGRYQAAAPDLVLDTATGKLMTSRGQILEQPINPTNEKVGRYSAAGWETAVTRSVGLNMINQPVAYAETVKGYILLDTQTGQVLKERVYYREPLQADDF